METNPTKIGYSIQGNWMPTRVEIQRITDTLLQQVADGNISASKAVTILRALSDAIEEALNQLKDETINELSKYPKGQAIVVNGVDFAIKEAGVRYDYSNCGDSFLLDMIAQRDDLDTRIKDRQKFLRGIKTTEMVVDTRTGELCELRPPSKQSTTTYSIKYPEQ